MPKIAYIEKEFRKKTLAIIDKVNAIIEDYHEQGYDLTLRQVFPYAVCCMLHELAHLRHVGHGIDFVNAWEGLIANFHNATRRDLLSYSSVVQSLGSYKLKALEADVDALCASIARLCATRPEKAFLAASRRS